MVYFPLTGQLSHPTLDAPENTGGGGGVVGYAGDVDDDGEGVGGIG